MSEKWSISRRSLLKWSGALAGAAAVGGLGAGGVGPFAPTEANADSEPKVIPTGCSNNCGGRCVIRAHVKEGVITRIESDPDPDSAEQMALRGCLRGRSYRSIVYHPDRLKYPMKRVGKRGEGKFERISWDEATTMIANELKRINEKHGALSIYPHYASGISGPAAGTGFIKRLLGLYAGDYLNYYGTYSSGQTRYATPYTYGTSNSGNHRADWVNSKLIILDGFNPAETVFGTNTMYYLRKAKEAGAKIIVIDPRYTDTALALADEWIPIRPGTDSALIDAMAYTMIKENLHDQAFLDKYCLGFDEEHMPAGTPAGNSYKTYVMGQADGQPKTPEWAQKITGIPANRIKALAREYAMVKPGALIQGFGPQRHANGEQSVRSATLLACMTGNVGRSGGHASGAGYPPSTVTFGGIPVKAGTGKVQISCFIWTDAIVRGAEMTAEKDLIVGAAKLPSNIKLIFNLAGNTLVNQHSDINKTAQILADESLCEFIVTSDIFMSPSAKFSDLVLPGTTTYERDNILTPWGHGEYAIYSNKVIEPMYECREEYDWLSDVAEKLGLKKEFTEGKSLEDWMKFCCEGAAKAHPEFPGFEAFKKAGVFRRKVAAPEIAFAKQIADPEKNKFATPSGKIELFSKALFDRKNPQFVPAVPKYVPAFDGPSDPLVEKYPLQMTGWHYKRRSHSTHDNNPVMTEAGRQEMWINPIDADARGIADGDQVKIFNDRGATLIPAKVTTRIMPGVIAVPQGAWYAPGKDGVDTHGAINILTTQRGSYMSNSNPQHTNLVEVVKA
ncbi:MAG: dmsA [Symbiobacteriaceae bacterium]|jgi:anaerobic dimethyl sulfoxide reductase subunit A|nr:dmsA [Symbiobacteriaceae bacterium]